VTADVKDKIGILKTHRQSNAGPNYRTVQSMVDFEVANKITTVKGKPPSGSRTLLRLHRALEFIMLLFEKIQNAPLDEKLQPATSEAYNNTLYKHHTWIIRKGVGLAFHMMPTKRQLLERMNGTKTQEEYLKQMDQVMSASKPVYDTVQQIYKENCILELP